MARNNTVSADAHAPVITRLRARFVTEHPGRIGWNDAVDVKAHRSFSNWAGCAMGPSPEPTVRAAIDAVQVLEPAPQAAVPGREERPGIGSAALVYGTRSHTWDHDDTHLQTTLHPAAPAAPVLLALREKLGKSGREMLEAAGCSFSSRTPLAVSSGR